MRKLRSGTRKHWWLMPLGLAAVALAAFVGFYILDHFVTGGGADLDPDNPAERYLNFDPDKLTDAVSALAAMIAAVLGIVITVVTIIVQLSAERYTGVAQMFLRDRINRLVMGYYVIACVAAVWLSMSLQNDWVPRSLTLVIMLATTFGLVIMLPFVEYVFQFLRPTNIVDRIRTEAVYTVERAKPTNAREYAALQDFAVNAMEELTDITSNSISGKDKIIASRAVDALKDYCLDYLKVKRELTDALDAGTDKHREVWFLLGEGIRKNPDFVAMAPESLAELEQRRTWFEWKILRQFLGIYNEALTSMRDINYLIAIDTRYIGERAAEQGDHELVVLVFRYMNSYLRATLNAKDVRTAYNVLNQYRLMVETMLQMGFDERALEGVRHMNYYGRVSYDMKLTFVTETVAYDISALCTSAHKLKSPLQDEMLKQFLELDQPLQVQSQEKGLLGVRKAQVKLAAYYLTVEEEAKARMIAEDMTGEPNNRLRVICNQLKQVKSKDFWEIIDRGHNFEFMPPDQQAKMLEFFAWLGVHDGATHETPE